MQVAPLPPEDPGQSTEDPKGDPWSTSVNLKQVENEDPLSQWLHSNVSYAIYTQRHGALKLVELGNIEH